MSRKMETKMHQELPGWKMTAIAREKDPTKHIDKYYYSPKEKFLLRSFAKTKKFHRLIREYNRNEYLAYEKFKAVIEQARMCSS